MKDQGGKKGIHGRCHEEKSHKKYQNRNSFQEVKLTKIMNVDTT